MNESESKKQCEADPFGLLWLGHSAVVAATRYDKLQTVSIYRIGGYVSTNLEVLEAEVLQLPPIERSHLLERLIASLDSGDCQASCRLNVFIHAAISYSKSPFFSSSLMC